MAKEKTIKVRVDEDLYNQLVALAESEERTISSLIRYLISKQLKQEK